MRQRNLSGSADRECHYRAIRGKGGGYGGGKSNFPPLTIRCGKGSGIAAGSSFGASENSGRGLQKYHSDHCFGGVTNDSFKHAVLCT